MKKFLLLFLVLCGGVCTVSAQVTETGYMKVYIQNKLKSSWSQIILRHWGYNGSRDAADVSAETETEIIDGIEWHVFKINIDYANNAPFLVYNGAWGTTNQSSNYDSDGSVYGDTFFDLEQTSTESQPYLTRQTRFYLYNTTSCKSIKLNTTNFSTYTYQLDNSTGSYNGNYVITSNYAYKDKGNGVVNDWASNVFRPKSSGDLDVEFANYSNQDAPRTSSGGIWQFSRNAIYDITFVPGEWSNAKWSIEPYFERTLPAAAEGYGTFSSVYDVLIPDGLTAQYAKQNGTSIEWVDYPATGIKAENGALLYGIAGETYQFKPASAAVATESTNYLQAATSAIADFKGVADHTCYILTNKTVSSDAAPLAFYKVNTTDGNNINAGSAYLKLPTSIFGTRDFFNLFNDTPTAVNVVEKAREDGVYYNLSGQRVAQPTKGLYIVDGKKVMIK